MADGDQQALAQFYDLSVDRVFSTVVRIVANGADAEEVVCEVFQQAWDRASLFDRSRGPAMTWLLNLAWSRAVDRIRRERRRREQSLNPDDLHAAYTDHDGDAAKALFDALDASTVLAQAMISLSDVQQRMLALAFTEDLTHAEIAQRTGVPLGTVKSHLRRALGVLRASFGSEGGADD